MKNVFALVTGGAGFIGSHVCESLLRDGYDIIIVDNLNPYYNPEYKKQNIRAVEQTAEGCKRQCIVSYADICDYSKLDTLFSEYPIECVIHLAAFAGVRPSIENAPLYMQTNIGGTVNILECMAKYSVRHMLFASSSSVYGNNPIVPFSEEHNVDHPISPYAASKKAGELVCHSYHHLYGINMACLRFFTVYGPRQRPDLAIYKFTQRILNNQPISFYGDGSTQRDYTYISDIVGGVGKALQWVYTQDKCFDVFNLGESATISLAEMVQTIEKATGKLAKLDQLPQQPGDVNITYADISKSKRVLGYNPTVNFSDGVHQFVNWFRRCRRT